MDANDGFEISLVVSKRLRRLLLYVTGLAAVAAGFILVATIPFVHLAQRWSAAHATIGVLLMALPLALKTPFPATPEQPRSERPEK